MLTCNLRIIIVSKFSNFLLRKGNRPAE